MSNKVTLAEETYYETRDLTSLYKSYQEQDVTGGVASAVSYYNIPLAKIIF